MRPQMMEQYSFIGSKNVTSNKELLHFLESNQSVLIYERDYNGTTLNCNGTIRDYNGTTRGSEWNLNKMNAQPDLMIDERTCVILQYLCKFDDEKAFDALKNLILSLSFKCKLCYIIVILSVTKYVLPIYYKLNHNVFY